MAEEGTSYFLDTSALVKLYHHELGSEIVEAWVANQAVQIWLSELARVLIGPPGTSRHHDGLPIDLEELSRIDDLNSSKRPGKVTKIARYEKIHPGRDRTFEKTVIVGISGGCDAFLGFDPVT